MDKKSLRISALTVLNNELPDVKVFFEDKGTLYTFNGSQRRRASYYVAKANQWSYWNVKVSTFANIDKVKELYFMMPNIVENGEAGSATVYVDEIAFTKKYFKNPPGTILTSSIILCYHILK